MLSQDISSKLAQTLVPGSFASLGRTTPVEAKPENVSSSIDLSQLLISHESTRKYYNASALNATSVIPKRYFQQNTLMKKLGCVIEETDPKKKVVLKNDIDLFNLNIGNDMMPGDKTKYKPIEKAGKVTARQLQKSLGICFVKYC